MSPRLKMLEKQFIIDGGFFKDFTIGGTNGLFEISSSKKKFNANSVVFGGNYPYVARTSHNNGIRGYINEDTQFLNPANTISFGQDTATIFFQDKPYFTGDKIKVLTFLYGELTAKRACYFLPVMRKAFSNFQWGQNSFSEAILEKITIPVPIDASRNIAFNFMEKMVHELETGFTQELDAYLNLLELSDYHLTKDEQEALQRKIEYKEFRIGGLFKKLRSQYKGSIKKQLNVSKHRNDEFDLPLINCKDGNNGIMYYGRRNDFTWYKNVLSIIYNGPPTEGQTYFQDEIGLYTDAYLIGLKKGELNREIGLFFTTAINKSIHNQKMKKYSRGNKATWENKVENDYIVLPVTNRGEPDYVFMNNYIKAVEKNIIKCVVDSKGRLLDNKE